MRTTLNLADDALIAARALARREGISLGQAICELARRGAVADLAPRTTRPFVGRFALLPMRNEVVTSARVRALMGRELM